MAQNAEPAPRHAGDAAAQELKKARSRLAALQAEHASLLETCRAQVADVPAGSGTDHLALLRGWLATRGLLPPPGAAPQAVLADSRTAMSAAAQAAG